MNFLDATPWLMYSGIAILSCARFRATTAGPGFVPQVTMAWASVPLIRVSWAVMSVSLGPKTSSATRVTPMGPARAFSSSRPAAPKASDTVRMATLVRPFCLACW